MKIVLKTIYGQAFRSLVAPFSISVPDSGLTLIKGLNQDTGDSSASGKSSLVLAMAHLFGGCPFPRTEFQSWLTEEPAMVGAVIKCGDGDYTVERRSTGLSVLRPDGVLIKGKSAEAELDRLFGLDVKMRALLTYRGQGQDGIFLSMSDAEKKEFFAQTLGLEQYEQLESQADEAAKVLERTFLSLQSVMEYISKDFDLASTELVEARKASDNMTDEKIKELETVKLDLERRVSNLASEFEGIKGSITLELESAIAKVRTSIESSLGETSTVVPELRAALSVAESRLNKVLEFERAQKSDLDGQRATAEKKIQEIDRVIICNGAEIRTSRKNLLLRQSHLEDSKCPTCLQQWANAKSELLTVHASLEGLGKKEEELVLLQQQKVVQESQLETVPTFEQHKFHSSLSMEILRLRDQIVEVESVGKESKNKELAELKIRESDLKQAAATSVASQRDVFGAAITEVRCLIDQTSTQINEMRRFLQSLSDKNSKVTQVSKKLDTARADKMSAEVEYNKERDFKALIGREGFLGVIFDDILDEVASATNNILSMVANVRHVVFEFDSQKESKSGNIQRRITPIVIVDGRKVSFSSGLSGGMQSAVKLAVDLAVGEVLSKRLGSYPGWLILDESFDGLGRVSKETCIEMLAKFAGDRTVFVIDHASEFQGQFSQIISVTSVDGKSAVSYSG